MCVFGKDQNSWWIQWTTLEIQEAGLITLGLVKVKRDSSQLSKQNFVDLFPIIPTELRLFQE